MLGIVLIVHVLHASSLSDERFLVCLEHTIERGLERKGVGQVGGVGNVLVIRVDFIAACKDRLVTRS